MKIELIDDILEEIADRFMIYGACKSEEYGECKSETPFCCRVGFTIHYKDRIEEALKNEEKLKKIGL